MAKVGLDYPGRPRILQDIDLAVHRGELKVLMGRSGSGKSSILTIAAGLRRPTRGRAGLLGKPYPDDQDDAAKLRKRHVGMVFQHLHLIPELTVAENIDLPLRLRHADRRRRKQRRSHLVEAFGLDQVQDSLPRTLSGGEQQRCAIARALAPAPDLLLVDEPTSALDATNARTVIGALQQATREGAAVLVVTHDELFAETGPVLHIVDGRIGDHERT